ncbi:hypothetical protein HDU98_011560 [Podochytrium sp. JEL0797]|nr:hypothetical protein HDU98_011560 [Podochytrium sp. JEL0797]
MARREVRKASLEYVKPLSALRATQLTVSGYVEVLTDSSWTKRLLVMCQESLLHMFETGQDPQALPISSMRIITCSLKLMNRMQILTLVGENGVTWVVRCMDEDIANHWTGAITCFTHVKIKSVPQVGRSDSASTCKSEGPSEERRAEMRAMREQYIAAQVEKRQEALLVRKQNEEREKVRLDAEKLRREAEKKQLDDGHAKELVEKFQKTLGIGMSGYLGKSSADAEGGWMHRFFVLSDDGRVHAFKSNYDRNAIPLSSLQVENCVTFFDFQEQAWILKIQGEGLTAARKRSWSLRCPDEGSMVLWSRSIIRVIDNNSTFGGSPIKSVASSFSSVEPPRLLRSGSNSSLRNASAMGRFVNDDRQAQMKKQHEDYLLLQQETAESKRQAYLAKKAEEDAAEAARIQMEADLRAAEKLKLKSGGNKNRPPNAVWGRA